MAGDGGELPLPIADRGLGRLIGATGSANDIATLYLERGALHLTDGAVVSEARDVSPSPRGLDDLSDQTTSLRAQIKVSEHGSELAPPQVDKRTIDAPNLVIDLRSGPTPWASLDLRWMKWDRPSTTFQVQQVAAAGGSAWRSLTPQQAIVDQTLLAARPGRALAADMGHFLLTPEALWSYSGLDQPKLISLHSSPRVEGQADGAFLLPGGLALQFDGQAQPQPDQAALTFGDLTVMVAKRQQRVSAAIQRHGASPANAFARTGFLHDQRQGVAYLDGRISVATPVGYAPVIGTLVGTEALPTVSPPASLATSSSGVFIRQGATWLRRSAAGVWSPGSDPFLPRQIASADGLSWTMTADGIDLSSPEAWRLARNGLAFDAERFVSMAGSPGDVVLVTGTGTRRVANGAEIRTAGAPDTVSVVTPLDMLEVTPGNPVIFSRTSSPLVWDSPARRWRQPGAVQPWQSRLAVDTAVLRLTLDIRGNGTERTLTGRTGQTSRVPFDWARGGGMPFDQAISVASTPDSLWIGTRFGLRRFEAQGAATTALFDPGQGGPVVPVPLLGVPEGGRDRLLAMTAVGDCLSLSGRTATGTCRPDDRLDRRLVHDGALWTWIESDRGAEGTYHVRADAGYPATLTIDNAWPHDDLASWSACGGQTAELWQGVSTLRGATAARRLPASNAVRFLCQIQSAILDGGRVLSTGRYLAGAVPMQETSRDVWATVQDLRADEINLRARGAMLFEAGRLKALSGLAAQRWLHRTQADQWRVMDWTDGLPSLDQTLGFVVQGNRLRRVTPAGVLTETLAGGTARLDPDSLLLENQTDFQTFRSCEPSRIELTDGQTQAVPALPGSPLRIWCRNEIALRETGQGGDIGAFATDDAMAFQARTLIASPDWSWEMRQSTAGAPPSISATFQGEVAGVTAGRFAFDSFLAVAGPFPRWIEVVAEDGWRRQPALQLGLETGVRPFAADVARNTTAVSADRDPEGQGEDDLLCAQIGGGGRLFTADKALRNVDRCKRWQGQDRFWSYRDHLDDGPEATGFAANGPLMSRHVENGRFTDLVAIGMPRPSTAGMAIPTLDGALIMEPGGLVESIYSFEDMRGLVPGGELAPTVLYGNSATRLLDGSEPDCKLKSVLGDTSGLTIPVATRRGDVMQFTLADAGRRSEIVTVDCLSSWVEPLRADLSVAGRARFRAGMAQAADATGVIRLQDKGDGQLELSDGWDRRIVLPWNAGLGDLLALIPSRGGRTMLIVYDHDVLELDTDAAISELAKVAPRAQGSTSPAGVARPADPPAARPDLPPPPRPSPPQPPPAAATAPTSTAPANPPQPARLSTVAPPPPPATGPAAGSPYGDSPKPWNSLSAGIVSTIQRALYDRLYYSGAIDGIPGSKTQAAVRAFQSGLQEQPTGVLTERQLRILMRTQ